MPKTIPYQQHLKALQKIIQKGETDARNALNRHTLLTNFHCGEYIQKNILTAPAGTKGNGRLVKKLSKGLKRPVAHFYRAAKFYRTYPKLPKQLKLSWGHYLSLITIADPKRRRSWERKALSEDLNCDQLYDRIKAENKQLKAEQTLIGPPSGASKSKLPVTRGVLYHYKVLGHQPLELEPDWVLLDLGFKVRREIRVKKGLNLHAGHCVKSIKTGEEGYTGHSSITASQSSESTYYTYKAYCNRVVDGDTLIVKVDLGFRNWVEDRIRLRGINCMEKPSSEGIQAMNFVKNIFKQNSVMVIRTYKEGKYGRFLADIFYLPGEKDPALILKKGIFLNQELLDRGYADLWGS